MVITASLEREKYLHQTQKEEGELSPPLPPLHPDGDQAGTTVASHASSRADSSSASPTPKSTFLDLRVPPLSASTSPYVRTCMTAMTPSQPDRSLRDFRLA
ncbi:hypothetical protein RJT34_08950 [Clitoria ternatea]|uniref:Uncharacterized protein n=1 Tax=Clitoria ternatea TaxID=43366 RepID=A0AAN9PUD6_CLITE